MNRSDIRELLNAHRLTAAIMLAIGIALLLTAISVSLYVRSGASRLDLSRPGYEAVREQVGNAGDQDNFSATGPMNTQTIDQFQTIYTKQRSSVEKLDPFSPAILSDESIRLIITDAQ